MYMDFGSLNCQKLTNITFYFVVVVCREERASFKIIYIYLIEEDIKRNSQKTERYCSVMLKTFDRRNI